MILLRLTRNLFCPVILESEPLIDSRSQHSSLVALSLLNLFLRNKFFSLVQFLSNLFHDLLGRVHFSIPSVHTCSLYLFEPDLPSTCLMQLKSLRFKLLIDLLRSDVRISLLPVPRLKFCFSFIHFLMSHCLSSDGRVNFRFNAPTFSSHRVRDVFIWISLRF